mgnify:CR=1 FL=1
MARLFDFAANQYVDVPDEEVPNLVGQGSHGFAQGQEIDIVLPNGQPFKIPGGDAAHALKLERSISPQSKLRQRPSGRSTVQVLATRFLPLVLGWGAGLRLVYPTLFYLKQ